MAIMHPSRVYHFNTASEKAFYEALREQLSDKYEVFYSVSWYGKDGESKRVNSESDFIVVDREKGFLCIEVKGGISYAHENDRYVVTSSNGSKVYRNTSAFEQAEKSMHFFYNAYEENYNSDYQGVYGFMAAFPFYEIKSRATEFFQVSELMIDLTDIQGGKLESAIRRAFVYWQGYNHTAPELFVDTSKKKLCNMFKRIYSIEASKGVMIEAKQEELDRINSTQDSIINLLSNYKSYAIKGAAGTGKSWIAFKKALQSSSRYYKTLLISKSEFLASYFKKQIDVIPDCLDITDFASYLQRFNSSIINTLDIKPEDKYTTIIVDEAQDFSEQEAVFLRVMLSDNANAGIVIFYDDEQTLNNNDEQTPKKFLIDEPPYVLTENLRNTKNIYDWARTRTALGESSFSNQVDGIDPIHCIYRNVSQVKRYLDMEIGKLLTKDKLSPDDINIIIDDELYGEFSEQVCNRVYAGTSINVYTTTEYKGLESSVVFYVHNFDNKYEYKYVGLTRAKFVLYDIEIRE